MIKSLRRKFIAIAMASVIIVLGCIMVIANLVNYSSVNRDADAKLTILEENDGIFPRGGEPGDGLKLQGYGISAETPFDTRYFSVRLKEDGTLLAVDTGKIAAVSTETAAAYAAELWSRGAESGFQDSYKYRAVTQADGTVLYLFLDCTRELDTFYAFLLTSLLVSGVGLLLVFLLVLLFSRLLLRPVAESYQKQRQFITDASHELKTPLTIIDASADVLEMENGKNEWTGSIKKQVARLASLTEKLVFLSRMEEAGDHSPRTDFSLSDAVLETARSFEPLASAQGKTMLLEVAPNITLHGQESAIRQLVSILLENAVKYTEEGDAITLSLRASGKLKTLVVANPAPNLTPGKWDVLFERFYRADVSRSSETGGYGIGLSVAAAIVAAHKGKIHARCTEEHQMLFTVTL